MYLLINLPQKDTYMEIGTCAGREYPMAGSYPYSSDIPMWHRCEPTM